MKNMKIEVNSEQPLDGIVMELKRLGFTPCMQAYWDGDWVATNNNKYAVFNVDMWLDWQLTTLSELKNMKCFDN